MTNLPRKPSRINFEEIDSRQIERILSTGNLESLTPEERDYFDLMEMVRGLRARMMFPGGKRIVTKAGIIKLLKSDAYGLSDWMARRIYADALNFFYSEENVRPRAWANLYAERYEKWADLAASMGKLKEAKSMLHEAAKLRGCYDEATPEIPQELLDASPVICLVRKSVDRQIQHFLVKCVKKTKNSGTNLRFRQSMPGTAAEKVSVRLTRNTILRSGHCLQ